jgi:tetratricopeptide (TPR) repeat protein
MSSSRAPTLLAAAIGFVLAVGAVAHVQAQPARTSEERAAERERRAAAAAQKAADRQPEEAKYPQAARAEPKQRAPAKLRKEVNALIEAYNQKQLEQALGNARAILANEAANPFETAMAAQIGAISALELDDTETAMDLFRRAVEADALGNNGHFDSMLVLAQLQLQEGREQAGLATLDRFLQESGSRDPRHLIMKGDALYRLKRYPEAAAAVKQALAAAESPDPSWAQLLVGIYLDMDQPQEAARAIEEILAKDPDNKRMQMNLATIYQQTGETDKAIATLEKVRSSGQLTDEKEYRQLYAAYLGMEGREADAIAVIEEGLAKGILKPGHEVYMVLGQSYYFTGNDAKAIENYGKAAPLDDDGETYLNLARVLWQADRIPEAKRAAQQALDKGVKKPEDAHRILALPN